MAADDDIRSRTQVGMLLLGASLRERREQAGWSMRQLADITGLSFDTIVSTEKGRRLPSLKSLDEIAKAYGTTARELLRGIYPWDGGQAPRP